MRPQRTSRPTPRVFLCKWSAAFRVWFFLLHAPAIFASDYVLKNWTTADGLPENTVRAIVETRDGFLWLGTANGLARFDGLRFTRYNSANTPALFADDIFGLHEDRSGGLWIRTRRGVFRYYQGGFQPIPVRSAVGAGGVGGFVEDHGGHLWIYGSGGLARWAGDKFEWISSPETPLQSVQGACPTLEGGLWLAGDRGLWRYQPGSGMQQVQVAPPPQIIATGPDGRLWGLVDEQRLFALQDGRWSEIANFAAVRCRTLYIAPDGDVWVGASRQNIAFRVRDGQITEINESHGLEGNRLVCFREDREGNLWVGMNGAGLYRLRERRLQVFDRQHGLPALSLAGVCEDDQGVMWVSVMGWTLHQFSNNRFLPVEIASPDFPYLSPTALVPARCGGVWTGTFYGRLARIQHGRVVERIGSEAGTRALFTDRDGFLWRGTRTNGVEHWDGTNITRYTVENGLSFENVYCFAQDPGGAVWAGTEEGLNRIENGRISRFGITNGLGHRFISALCVDSRGTLWAGTLGGGLSAWNGSRFVTLSTREGLADDTVTQLLEDNYQYLWIGTRTGLLRVALDQLHGVLDGRCNAFTGTLVGLNEGLVRPDTWTEYQPASLKASDGRLWFCTGSGVVVIDPERFAKPAPAPAVHIEEVILDEETRLDPRQAAGEVRISAKAQRVEIRYTGISPSAPEQVRFRYQLANYDNSWVEAGQRRVAYYSHVKPGRYEFSVRAANNDGVWNEAGDTLTLVFEPAFWQTNWFRTLLAALFLGVGPTIYIWRVRRLERRRFAQETFSQKLINSQEQERQRIAAELHDSLGQNLLVIKNRAVLALTHKEEPEKMAAQVAEVSAMASAAIREVREIAQNLRPFQLDELGLTRSITAMIRKLADSTRIEFQTDLSDLDGALPVECEIHFYRVVQECLSNVIKHSRASTATVRTNREQQAIRLVITDDGCGFEAGSAEANLSLGAGLGNILERVRTMGGHVTFHSHPGKGTTVEITIPLKQSATV